MAGALVASALLLSAACTGDGRATEGEQPSTTAAAGTEASTTSVTTIVPTSAPTDASDPTSTGVPAPAGSPSSDGPRGSSEPPSTTFEVVEVPATGVPGLDSDDSFCAAWSRFGGSWQVVQVAANFAPDPAVVPAMEVAAAPVVTAAYDSMLAAWPDELTSERDGAADGFFGPFDRRAGAALDALRSAGATDAEVGALGRAWEAALAARRPDDPVVTVELSDDLRALVDAAVAEFVTQRVGFVEDPSMRITVATPLTDAYLATACPDQGALAGGEIDAG